MLLPPAILTLADRLAAILMAVVEIVGPVALAGGTPAFPRHTAHTVFHRLAHLVAALIRMCALGVPKRNAARPRPAPASAPVTRSSAEPAQRLPTRSGWLLAALPELLPAIKADLAALLADPALAPLLAAAPGLRRALRPILRSLGLTLPPSLDTSPTRAASAPNRPIPRDPAPAMHYPPIQPPASNRS